MTLPGPAVSQASTASAGKRTTEGLAAIRKQIKPGGCFALWSNDPANEEFTKHLREAFGTARSHTVEFPNPYTNSISVNSVYVARNDR